LLGELITGSLGWNWTFSINMPVAGIAALAAFWLLPKDDEISLGRLAWS
jgi:predicted MFS family arabinose efflux permease